MKYNKYIIVCSNVSNYDTDTLANIIKNEIAEKWFTPITNTWIIGIPIGNGFSSAAEIRDKINHRVNCSVLVFQVRTTKNAAACRNFASDKLWNWIKDFDSNDDIKSEPELIPDVGLNNLNRDMTRPGL